MDYVSCVIADDSALFRRIFSDIVLDLGLTILQEYHNGEDLLYELDTNKLEPPDVIFLDINMPGRSGKDLLEDILDIVPEAIIIMVTTVNNVAIVNECLTLGASNYIDKNTNPSRMKEIIISTLKNNGY